jgi:four helix bundle protein
MGSNVVLEKSFAFSVEIVRFSRPLWKTEDSAIANQLLRSGTSIGANIEEAQSSLTRREFTAKMSIAAKEARETLYWLRLLKAAGAPGTQVPILIQNCEELVRLLTSIVKSAQSNIEK